MQSEDWILSVFFGALALATALSLFLWFVKGTRSGALVWTAYGVRALGGLFIVAASVYAADVLSSGAGFWDVAVFAGPIGLIGLLLATPWGLIRLAKQRNPARDSLA